MKSILEVAKILGCIAQINEYNQAIRNTNAKLGISLVGSVRIKGEWEKAINRLNTIIAYKQLIINNRIYDNPELLFGGSNVVVSVGGETSFCLDEAYLLGGVPLTLFDVFDTNEIRAKLSHLPPHEVYQLTSNRDLQTELVKYKAQFKIDFNAAIKSILKYYGFYYDSVSGKVSNELGNYSLFIDGGQELEYFKLDLPCLFLASFSGCLSDAIRVFGGGTRNAYALNEVLIIKK